MAPHTALLLLLCGPALGASESQGDVRDVAIRDFLIDSTEVEEVGSSYVHVGIILAGIRGVSTSKRPILEKLEEMLLSVFLHSHGTRLHFVVFTDEESRPHITAVFKNEAGRFLSESILRDRRVRGFRLKVEYVDLAAMVERNREDVDDMKKLFGYHHPEGTIIESKEGGPVMVPTVKYTKDLFYIAPLLHRELPRALEKLVMLDIDLEFRIGIKELYNKFADFSETEMIGLANELSPHYYNQAQRYITAHPGTGVGSPGRGQGFNTGVALYHLAKMRASKEFGAEVEVERMRELVHYKYMVAGTVGDQDWLTVLGWESPHLFHLLPCSFNLQTHQGYNTAQWAAVWAHYRNCTQPEKIIHKNGSFWNA